MRHDAEQPLSAVVLSLRMVIEPHEDDSGATVGWIALAPWMGDVAAYGTTFEEAYYAALACRRKVFDG